MIMANTKGRISRARVITGTSLMLLPTKRLVPMGGVSSPMQVQMIMTTPKWTGFRP